jgi:hypothetical protein
MSTLNDRTYSRALAALAVIYVLCMYSGGADFAVHRLGDAGFAVARGVIYAYFALALSLAPVMLMRYRPVRLTAWTLILTCCAAALLVIAGYHLLATPQEGGLVTKSFITAVLHIWTLGFLFSLPSAARATRLTTVMVVLACGLFILAEVVAPSSAAVPGRGGGFYLNPNVAALALVLGSIGALQGLPPLWRLPFLAFVGVVVFATLSRSGMVAAAATWAAWLAVEWTAIRSARQDYARGALLALAVVAGGAVFFTLVASREFQEFAVRTSGPVIGEELVPAAPRQATPSIQQPQVPAPAREVPPLPEAATVPPVMPRQQTGIVAPPPVPETPRLNCGSWTVVFEGLAKAETCWWLQQERVARTHKRSSGEARAVLALRSVAAFMDSPFIGIGLERAHDVQAHNALLLFGIAYGVLGLFLMPAFALFLVQRLGGWRPALPFVVFLFVSSIFSHDLLLTHVLIAGWVIALSAGSLVPAALCGRGLPAELPLSPASAGSSTRKT